MRTAEHAALLTAVVFLAIGCKAKLTSDVTLDGKAVEIESCRSGEASGFTGVDLIDTGGTKIRLVTMPSGLANALLFRPGSAEATDLGVCGPLNLERQNSQINDIYNVKGSATLDCGAGTTKVKGTITFENCH